MPIVETSDGRRVSLSDREFRQYQLIEQIAKGSQDYWREEYQTKGREAVRSQLEVLGDTGRGTALGVGAMHGASHGLSDDVERAFFSDGRDKLESVLGQKLARQHMASQVSHPATFLTGQVLGGAAVGYGTRLATKGVGGLLAANKADNLAQMRKLYGANPTPKQTAKLSELARVVERRSNLGLPSEKARAFTLDTMHGALAGYGGYYVDEDEGLLDADRLARAGAGGAAGFAIAPIAAGAGSGASNVARKVRIDRGGRVAAPGYKVRFKNSPEDTLRIAMGQDEHTARRGAPRGTAQTAIGELSPMDRGASNSPVIFADRQTMPNTTGLVDHAITNPSVSSNLPREGLRTQDQTRMMRRLSQAPGGGPAAQRMANEARTEAEQVVGSRIDDVIRAQGAPSRISTTQQSWVDDLTDVFLRGDFEASEAWGRAVNTRLNDAGRSRLRLNIASEIKRAYDEGGADAVMAMLGDPKVAPFLDQVGFKRLSQSLNAARQGSGLYRAVERAMQEEILPAVSRDNVRRRPVAQYANRLDQRLAGQELIDSDAQGLMNVTQAGARRPRVIEPVDPRRSAPLLENEPVSWGDVGRRAYDEAIRPLRSGAHDYSTTTVNVAGAASTGGVLVLDKYIHKLVEMGFPPEEARLMAERLIQEE